MSSPVKALVTIVDRGRARQLSALLNKKYSQASFVMMGHGTASSDILDMLGIDSSDKDVIITFADAQALGELMNELSGRKLMRFSTKGIAFSIPLGAIGSLFQAALLGPDSLKAAVSSAAADENEEDEEKGEETMKSSSPYSLILVVAEKGQSENIMHTARAAGATGGTVVTARGVGHGEAEHFLGITLLEEKEIVGILSSAEKKTDICRALNREFGVRTDAKALVVALPVDEMTQVN